jgi:AcrR family transcriptional regulator
MFRRGYASTTIDDIAGAAGATRRTFYLHFTAKADVIIELVTEARAEFHPLWDILGQLSPRPDREAIRGWLMAITATWKSSRERTRVIFDAIGAEPELNELRDRWHEEQLDLLFSALRHMEWESEAYARIECMLLLAELERGFEFWNAEHDVGSEEILLDVLADHWWRALNPDR